MKQLRADADLDHKRQPPDALPARAPVGESGGKLSELDATSHAGKRLGQLGGGEREQVADQALANATGSVPHGAEMESRFGQSFSDVKVADSPEARETLSSVGADGVAKDRTIAFSDASPSKETVAHELAHVVQADGATGGSSKHAEREAHGVETQLAMGGGLHATPGLGGAGVAHFRDRDGDGSHDAPLSPYRTPEDEVERYWGVANSQMSDPLLVPDLDPGAACPFPPNAKMERAPSHHRRPDDDKFDFFKDEDADPPVIVDHFRLTQRQEKWTAYRNIGLGAQAALTQVKPDIDAYHHAEGDADLNALGFIFPGKKGEWSGNVSKAAMIQEVPKQGGTTVGDVMGGPTKDDTAGIEKAETARQNGKGGIQKAFTATTTADEAVKAAADNVGAAAADLAARNEGLTAAIADVEHLKAEEDAENATGEIAALKAEAQGVKDVIGFFTGLPERLSKLGTESINPLSAIGTVGTMMIDLIPDPRLTAAEAKLATAKQEMKDATAKKVAARYEEARKDVLRTIKLLSGTRHTLRSALSARRAAYDNAGEMSGAAAGTGGKSNDRVAAMISAIPIVEIAIARIGRIYGQIRDYRTPAYTKAAGIGYGIALHHQNWAAYDLPAALGLIENIQMNFAFALDDWQTFLAQLLAVKEQIGGVRPDSGGTADMPPAR